MRRYRAKRSGEPITLGDPVGFGGQGTFYPVAGRPDLGAKVYDAPPADLADRLDAMIDRPPHELLDPAAPASCAWPRDSLMDADGRGQCVGPLVPFARGRRSLAELVNPAARGPGVTRVGLVRAFRNTARAVALLHGHGIVVGDLSPHNVLADEAGNVTLIDTESVQITSGGRAFGSSAGTPDCTPPEWQGAPRAGAVLRTSYDLFALGVLGGQATMDGVHMFAGVPSGRGLPVPVPEQIKRGWWMFGRRVPVRPPRHAPPFDSLPAEVRELFRQCFVDGHADPLRRPAAQTWVDVLDTWLAAGVGPPTAAAVTAPAASTIAVQVPDWAVRAGNWVEKHPGRTWAAIAAALGLVAGGVWWMNREPEPPGPGGKPTPALWKKLRPDAGR